MGSNGLTAKAFTNCGHFRCFQGLNDAASLMQNIVVATTPDNSNPSNRKPLAKPAHDFFLDPLPVPDATESSTDTAWGLWEHTLKIYEDEAQKPADVDRPGFEDTEISGLIPPRDKP
jgi:hypothetical protein